MYDLNGVLFTQKYKYMCPVTTSQPAIDAAIDAITGAGATSKPKIIIRANMKNSYQAFRECVLPPDGADTRCLTNRTINQDESPQQPGM